MKLEYKSPPFDMMTVEAPYSQHVGIIGRFFRLLWAPIAYVLGLNFKL